jgi:hypothetical protein
MAEVNKPHLYKLDKRIVLCCKVNEPQYL